MDLLKVWPFCGAFVDGEPGVRVGVSIVFVPSRSRHHLLANILTAWLSDFRNTQRDSTYKG